MLSLLCVELLTDFTNSIAGCSVVVHVHLPENKKKQQLK
jgi:hypothetical protein